jgi:hypothetical protein
MHSGVHKLIKILLHLQTKPYDFDFPFAAVAGLATGAIQLYHYSGCPLTWQVKAVLDAYFDRLHLAALEDIFPQLTLPPPVLPGTGITPPPPIPDPLPITAAGEPPPSPPGHPDGEMTVSENSEDELSIITLPTRRRLRF